MLIENGSRLYMYSVTRDLGFAPNPFFGVCTLATCKPRVRKAATVGDWVIGVVGANMKKKYKGKCIFIMKVSEVLTFDQYWVDARFSQKKAVRNGSKVQMLGDNVYHKDINGEWVQEDSHHSNLDGSKNMDNLERDTGRTDNVLVSDLFIYFGSDPISIPLESVGYKRIRDFRKVELDSSKAGRRMISAIFSGNKSMKNMIVADPFHFDHFTRRVDQKTGKYGG